MRSSASDSPFPVLGTGENLVTIVCGGVGRQFVAGRDDPSAVQRLIVFGYGDKSDPVNSQFIRTSSEIFRTSEWKEVKDERPKQAAVES